MFLLLGPSLVALAVWMVAVAIAGRIDDAFVALCATASFLLTLPVSAITGLVDGYLAPALPAPLRAPLTAAIGAALASGLSSHLVHDDVLKPVPPEVMNGALCAGRFSCCCRWACARCCRTTMRPARAFDRAGLAREKRLVRSGRHPPFRCHESFDVAAQMYPFTAAATCRAMIRCDVAFLFAWRRDRRSRLLAMGIVMFSPASP